MSKKLPVIKVTQAETIVFITLVAEVTSIRGKGLKYSDFTYCINGKKFRVDYQPVKTIKV